MKGRLRSVAVYNCRKCTGEVRPLEGLLTESVVISKESLQIVNKFSHLRCSWVLKKELWLELDVANCIINHTTELNVANSIISVNTTTNIFSTELCIYSHNLQKIYIWWNIKSHTSVVYRERVTERFKKKNFDIDLIHTYI